MLNSGDVIDLDLGIPEGREAGMCHPAIVLTAQRILDAGPSVVQIIPLTSTMRPFESELRIQPDLGNGLSEPSAAQCQHIRAISTARIARTRGNIGAGSLAQMREMVAVILDLP